jgi:hypothetical protein
VPTRDIVLDRIRAEFTRMGDLAAALPDGALGARLPAPSSSIGNQLWCVIGGRESYTASIVQGAWAGFTCSLDYEDRTSREVVLAALTAAEEAFEGQVAGIEWDDDREGLLLDLLEHEAQHQGQMIRYLYGLGLPIPASWKDRWALCDG